MLKIKLVSAKSLLILLFDVPLRLVFLSSKRITAK